MIQINPNEPTAIALREAEAKRQALLAERQTKRQQLEALEQEYARRRALSAKDRLEREAESVLAGTPVEDVSVVEIQDLQHQLQVQEKAIEMQNAVVQSARNRFTKAVCEANRERYLEIVKRIARAVKELSEAEFFEALRDAGCGGGNPFRPVRPNAIGLASDPNSGAACHRRELQEFVPEALAQ